MSVTPVNGVGSRFQAGAAAKSHVEVEGEASTIVEALQPHCENYKMLRTYVRPRSSRKGGVLRTTTKQALCHDPLVAHTVVIVDDHPSFRASARAILEASKFEIVAEVSDGAAALAAVAEHCPDVVLLDVQLPDMTGFEICNLLDEEAGRLPAIVLTSSRDQADYGDLVESSCARGFLPKAELSGEALAALVV